MRVVSICPSNTEIVAYLGKTDWLVGVDDYSDWPEEVNELPKVGPDLAIDMAKIAALKPDLVLASLSVPGMEKNIEALSEQQIPFIVLNPQTLIDIANDIERVANALGELQLGRERAKHFRTTITKFKNAQTNNSKWPHIYWEWWPKPVFTPGKTNWLTEVSQLAGAENLFATEETANYQTSWEEVKQRNPDYICMVWVGVNEHKMRPDKLAKRPGWQDMKAVRNGRIYVMEESLYCRPSPRLLDGIEKLNKLLKS